MSDTLTDLEIARLGIESQALTIRDLRAVNAELVAALDETMSWINGWDPSFAHDDEWPATKAKVRAAIAKAKETT